MAEAIPTVDIITGTSHVIVLGLDINNSLFFNQIYSIKDDILFDYMFTIIRKDLLPPIRHPFVTF